MDAKCSLSPQSSSVIMTIKSQLTLKIIKGWTSKESFTLFQKHDLDNHLKEFISCLRIKRSNKVIYSFRLITILRFGQSFKPIMPFIIITRWEINRSVNSMDASLPRIRDLYEIII